MNPRDDRGAELEALDRLIDAGLHEELGDGGREDLAGRVAAAWSAGAPVGPRRWWTALLVAAGVGVVAWIAGSLGDAPPEPTAPETGVQDPQEQDGRIRFRDVDHLRELLAGVVRIDARAFLLPDGTMLEGPEGMPAPVVEAEAAEVEAIVEVLKEVRTRDAQASMAWPNAVRVHVEGGRFFEFTWGRTGEPLMSFRSLGDVVHLPGAAAALDPLIERAEWAAARVLGVVRSEADLRRRGEDGYPRDLEALRIVGRPPLDLGLAKRFTGVRRVTFGATAAAHARGFDFEPLTELPGLEEVRLRHATLTKPQLSWLTGIPALRRLDLEYATVVDARMQSGELNALETPWALLPTSGTLQELKLGYAQPMDDAGIRHLTRIPDLRILDLSGRRLGSVTPLGLSVLDAATKLEELHLSLCPVDLGPLLAALADAGARIRVLDLSDTGVTVAALGRLDQLDTLEELDLSRCPGVDGDALTAIGRSGPVRELILHRCRGLEPDDLAALRPLAPTLTRLVLGDVPLTDASCRHLLYLYGLRHLDLGFTGIGDEGVNTLRLLRYLRHLDLTNCDRVTDTALETLGQAHGNASFSSLAPPSLPALRTLDLSLCDGITGTGVAKLKEARPDLEVDAPDFD